jgi:hypothetical protein
MIIENSNRQLNSCNACVCVKTETTRFEKIMTGATGFPKEERICDRLAKSQTLLLLGPSHPHLIHSP